MSVTRLPALHAYAFAGLHAAATWLRLSSSFGEDLREPDVSSQEPFQEVSRNEQLIHKEISVNFRNPSKELVRYQKALSIAIAALRQYADPEFYHAITIIGDRPTGGFDRDISKCPDSDYERPMPGKIARAAIKKLEKSYGNLQLLP